MDGFRAIRNTSPGASVVPLGKVKAASGDVSGQGVVPYLSLNELRRDQATGAAAGTAGSGATNGSN